MKPEILQIAYDLAENFISKNYNDYSTKELIIATMEYVYDTTGYSISELDTMEIIDETMLGL